MSGRNISKIINDLTQKEKTTLAQTLMSSIKKIFKTTFSSGFGVFGNKLGFKSNIDEIIYIISNAKKTDGYIARASKNFLQKSLKTGFYFDGFDDNFALKINEKFESLILRSGYSVRGFLRECLKNYIDFSNVYIYKSYALDKNKNEYLKQILVMPSIGWTIKKTIGSKVLEWTFDNGSESHVYTNEEIIHITFNKENHEVFGTPFMMPTLEDVQILREVEARAFEDYFDSTIKKTLVRVGDKNMPATENQLNEARRAVNDSGDLNDIVISGICTVEVLQPSYVNPETVLKASKERVMSGLQSSATQMGVTGSAGRQDADTQNSNTSVSVEDFQENLEDALNPTLIRELIIEETNKEVDCKTKVEFKFLQTFDEQERKEKHYTHLFVSGVLDLNETRNSIGRNPQSIDINKTYTKLYQSEPNGSAENASNPKNQYGSTGTTKKSVKN